MEAPKAGEPALSSGAPDGGGEASRTAIVVFARLPVPGRVKTRLAAGAGVGPVGACDFYRACAEAAISHAASCAPWADACVYHSSADSTADVASWLAGQALNLTCRPQLGSGSGGGGQGTATRGSGAVAAGCAAPEPDLGAKMLAAMAESQRSSIPEGGRKAKVLIIGTDIPDITGGLLRRAADALDEHEMVIGPSLDGGYYLLGLTRLEPRLFQDMRWSTEHVLSDTLERAAAAGLRVAPLTWLPRLRDVDTVQDLAEWVASCGAPDLDPPDAPLGRFRFEMAAVQGGDRHRQPEASPGQQQLLQPLQPQGRAAAARGFLLAIEEADLPGLVPAGLQDALKQRQQHLLLVSKRVLEEAGVAVVAP